MLPEQIRIGIESDAEINQLLAQRFGKYHWHQSNEINRSHFSFIAQIINQRVTKYVIENDFLVKEKLVLGDDLYHSVLHEIRSEKLEDFMAYLQNKPIYKPFTWISGKALESYWQATKPKEVKLNVLLVFLNVPISAWISWKHSSKIIDLPSKITDNASAGLLKKYIGSYFLYCLKTDKSSLIVKSPFIIFENEGQIVAETTTEGHRYMSLPITRMEGHLQIICKNLDWNETETHIFNIGLKTTPHIVFGVSVTLSVNMGTPVALKNILIKQSDNPNFLKNTQGTELSWNNPTLKEEEQLVVAYFKKMPPQALFAEFSCTLEEFKEKISELELQSVK